MSEQNENAYFQLLLSVRDKQLSRRTRGTYQVYSFRFLSAKFHYLVTPSEYSLLVSLAPNALIYLAG